MSYEPPRLPATWQEGAAGGHTAVDLTSSPSVADDLTGLESWPTYCRIYKEGLGKDYGDLRDLECVRRAGVDREGNPLYLFVPGNLLPDTDLDRVRRYAIQLMHEHVREGRPYSVIFVQNNVSPAARAVSTWFVVQTYRMLPRPFKKNLRMIGVLHPTGFVRACLLLLSPFLADSFWDKLYLVERIDFLDDIVGRGGNRVAALGLPEAYAEWDDQLEAMSREDEEALRSGVMYPQAMGMGGAMGGALFQGAAPLR